MLNDFEKFIYNKHLSVSRQAIQKPYNLRKDFSDISESTLFFIKKLSLFFKKFNHINIDDFFKAPYSLYKDENYFDLKFFITPKAIKTYNLFLKSKRYIDPDNSETLKFTADSIKFIKIFCKEKNINIEAYLNFIDKNETIPSFVNHLHTHKINIYSLFGLPDFRNKIFKNYETYKFILGNIIDDVDLFYNNFIKSKKLKILVKEGYKKIT